MFKSTDKQELFNLALEGVRKQGRPSITEDGHCVYQLCEGVRCGAGWLMTDEGLAIAQAAEVEDAESGTIGIRQLVETQKVYITLELTNFISQLQGCHDNATDGGDYDYDPDEYLLNFNADMEYLAGTHGLAYTPA